jgi:hypothetical protein
MALRSVADSLGRATERETKVEQLSLWPARYALAHQVTADSV